MADGSYKFIKNIQIDDLILTMNEATHKIEVKPVLNIECNGEKELIRIKTRSGKFIDVTGNHPIFTNNEWVNADLVNVGDLVASSGVTIFGTSEMKEHEIDVLSIWLAEGSKYTVANGTEEITDVLKLGVAAFGRGMSATSKDNLHWKMSNGDRSGGPLTGSNNPVRTMLENFDLFKKNSKTKFIPDSVFKLPKPQLARFLNLFYACDGNVSLRSKNTWGIEVQLANEHMIRQISKLLMKFGINGQIRYKKHIAKSSVSGDNFESWRLIISDSEMIVKFADEIGMLSKEVNLQKARTAAMQSRGNCNSYLPVSHDDLINHLVYTPVPKENGNNGGFNFKVARDLPEELRLGLNSWRKQTDTRVSRYRFDALRRYTDGYFDKLRDGDIVWEDITSIENVDASETWDLEIEGNHNFISNDIVTHNSKLSQISLLDNACEKPGSLNWYVAPTYRMAKQIMWDDMNRMIPDKWVRRKNETFMRLDLVNGSIIELKGADKEDSLRGVGLDYLVMDEMQDMRPGVWKTVLRPTLAVSGGGALFIGTSKGYNHFYDVWLRGMSGESRMWKSWQFPTVSSPFVPEDEIENARRDMDPKTFRQEFEASFENMSGRVYHVFDRKLHVGNYPFNPKLPIYIGQDFNIDPMSSAIMQVQPNGDVWAVDEIVLFSSNTQEVCEEIERKYWRYTNQITIYPDPAGGARQHARGETDLDIFREKGFKRIKHHRKHPRITDRVNAVNKMLLTADGEIRMRVNSPCKHLITSLEQTMYKPGGREIDKAMSVEHITDGLGYYIEYEFPARKISVSGISL